MPFVTEDELDPLPTSSGASGSWAGNSQTPSHGGIIDAVMGGIPFSDEIGAAGGALGKKTIAPLLDFLTGNNIAPKESFGDVYDQELARTRGRQQDYRKENPISGLLLSILGSAGSLPNLGIGAKATGAFTNPVLRVGAGAAGYAAEGGLLSGVQGFSQGEGGIENRTAKAVGDAKTGALLSALLGGGLLAAKESAPAFMSAGKALRRKMTGAGTIDYSKSAKDLDVFDIADDEIETATKKALDYFDEAGKLKNTSNSKRLAAALKDKEAVSASLGKVLQEADEVGTEVVPELSTAIKYLDRGKAGDDTEELLGKLIKLEDDIESARVAGKPMVEVVQNHKNYWGGLFDKGNKAKNGFYHAVYYDLKRAVEDAVPAVRPINQELSKYHLVLPILKRGLAPSESKNVITGVIDKLRTSGGTLTTPTAIGTIIGSSTYGGPVGLVAGAILGAASSPKGQGGIGSALKGVSRALAKAPADAAPMAVTATLGAMDGGEEIETSSIQGGRFVTEDELDPLPEESTPLAAPEILSARTGKEVPPKEDIDLDTLGKVPEAIVKKVVYVESRGRNDAVSPKGATGKFQLMPATFNEWAPRIGIKNPNIKNPEHNEKVGRAYLNYLSERYGGNPALYLAAYNWGMGRVDKLLSKVGPDATAADLKPYLPAETKGYLKQILA